MPSDQKTDAAVRRYSGPWECHMSSFWSVAVFAILILFGSTGYQIIDARDDSIKHEQEQLQTEIKVIQTNLESQISSVCNVLKIIQQNAHTSGLNQRLSDFSQAMPGVRTLIVVDKRGKVRSSNRNELLDTDFSRREYFQYQNTQANKNTVFVSAPFISTLNRWIIVLSLPILKNDGSFDGIVGIALDPEYFSAVMNSVLYSVDMKVAIIHADGLVFMTVPEKNGAPGTNLSVPDSFFTKHIQSGKNKNIFTGTSYLFGKKRIAVLQTFNPPQLKLSRPLIVSASRDKGAVLLRWRRETLIKCSIVLVMSVLLFAGANVLRHRKKKLDHQAQLLIEEQINAQNEIFRLHELQKNNLRLELLQEVNQYNATTIQGLLDFSLEKVIALTESSIGYIYHYNEETEQFVLNTWSKDVMASCRVAEPLSIYQLDKTGLWGDVVRQRRAIIVNDYATPSDLKKGCPEGHVPLSRFLSIPVFDKESIVAVVGVANKVHPYDQSDQLQLTLMMDSVWKIASRLKMEEQILRAGHEWQSTFDSISDSIALIDTEQLILRCNKATCAMLNRSYADIIGQPCWQLFHGSDYHIPDCPMLRSKQSLQSETATVPHGDGWWEVSVDPVLSHDGKLISAVHIVRDVTQRKQLEQELRSQAMVMSGVFDSTDSSVFSIDNTYRYTSFNASHKKAMKNLYNADIQLGDVVTGFMTREDAAVARANLEKAMTGEAFVVEASSGNSTLMSSVFQISFNPIKNSKGVVEGVAIFARDISEERKSDESVREMQIQLVQNDKMATIGQLAAGVAHEINNPMGFVSSNLVTLGKYIEKYDKYINLLESGVRNPADQSLPDLFIDARKAMKLDYVAKDIIVLLEESNEGIERVKRIVRDLRTFSRADASEMGSADLNSCIDSTINIVISEIRYSAEVDRHYGDLPKVSCNVQQISQVFMNLIINAAHAIQAKGEEVGAITITTWNDESNVFVSVSDNGCGVPQNRLDKIFDAFYTTKDVGKGTGLGLSISSGIIKKHGGAIMVSSEEGVGSTFTVRLPIKPLLNDEGIP